jgi:hypothetical protein
MTHTIICDRLPEDVIAKLQLHLSLGGELDLAIDNNNVVLGVRLLPDTMPIFDEVGDTPVKAFLLAGDGGQS